MRRGVPRNSALVGRERYLEGDLKGNLEDLDLEET